MLLTGIIPIDIMHHMTETLRALKPHWFHILVALADGERHGSAIVRSVLEQTDGALRLWPVMLQTALQQMTEEELIEPLDAPPEGESERRRYYRLTRAGRKAAAAEADRLAKVARHARAKLAPKSRLAPHGGSRS
jgi:DNA-binding PadR family transcriptional regulator